MHRVFSYNYVVLSLSTLSLFSFSIYFNVWKEIKSTKKKDKKNGAKLLQHLEIFLSLVGAWRKREHTTHYSFETNRIQKNI